ncbi:MAG TPA: hypothetical protein PLL69_07715, partial [Gemmatimonadales bacterium]|nr:hypothetical protein [Gemmatimonadales bacterium]
IDREAFDGVLERAAELQAHGRDIGEGLTEEEVLQLGTEVGIPEAQLRQALLEERTRVTLPEATGTLDRWVAPATVATERVVQGEAESIGAALTRWFEQQEILVVQRRTTNRISWEQAHGFASSMKRLGWTLNSKRSKPFLDKAELVTALITPLEPGFCHVTLVASLRNTRSAYLGGGIGMAGAGTAMGAVAMVLGAPLLVLPAVAIPAVVGGAAITRAFRPMSERARLGLERALDELERQPTLPTAERPRLQARALSGDLGDVVRDIAVQIRRAFEEPR